MNERWNDLFWNEGRSYFTAYNIYKFDHIQVRRPHHLSGNTYLLSAADLHLMFKVSQWSLRWVVHNVITAV